MSTVVSFFVHGALRGVSTHWAFPARLPQGRDSGTCLDLTQWTHHNPVLCALRDRIPSHLLSSCSTTTKLRQTTGCVSPSSLERVRSPPRKNGELFCIEVGHVSNHWSQHLQWLRWSRHPTQAAACKGNMDDCRKLRNCHQIKTSAGHRNSTMVSLLTHWTPSEQRRCWTSSRC